MENRHAYCIIAHHDPVMLCVLVTMLDHPLNDVYILIDGKVDIKPFLIVKTHKSRVCFLADRISVEWGNPSQIDAELLLLEYASSHGNYSYYHIMSGQDLPLYSQDYIHEFMDTPYPRFEFVSVNQPDEVNLKDIEYKTRYYHFFVKSLSDTEHSFSHFWHYYLHAVIVNIQKLIGIKRKYPFELKKGLHFASITQEFVGYLLSKKDSIRRVFAHTLCADEIFLQSILWNSPFRENLYVREHNAPGNMRKVVWINHKAIVWKKSDYNQLITFPELFALKFSSQDPELLLLIAEHNGCRDAVQAVLTHR